MHKTAQEKCRSYAGLEAALLGKQGWHVGIDDLIVDIVWKGRDSLHVSSGVLLTQNGFILTAFHGVSHYNRLLKSLEAAKGDFRQAKALVNEAGKYTMVLFWADRYELDLSVFIGSEVIDCAVVKANMPGDPVPTGVRFAEEPPMRGQYVEAVGRLGSRNSGSITLVHQIEDMPAFITTSALAISGMSGGAFVNQTGEYCGAITHADTQQSISVGPTIQYMREKLFLPAARILQERWLRRYDVSAV